MSRERPLLSDRAIQIVAENRIRAAFDAGEFDDLPGYGRPSPLVDEPYDPHWWIRRKLKREGIASLVPVDRPAGSLFAADGADFRR